MEQREIIRIEGLTKRFPGKNGDVVALENIDLSINEGEIFGIIGLSGAGKSTLVRCINLLERPTEGRVTVAGQELSALKGRKLREARRGIGMIFQQFNLLMQRTALENICFPLLLAGVNRRDAEKRALELLETVGLAEKRGAYPAQLSGGQKQRVAIARALANEPKVLLCDEATSALDPTTTRSILSLLKEINERLGITVIVITHEMRVVEEICSRVAILDASHVAELGRVEEIFRRPKTAAARRLLFPGREQHPEVPAFGTKNQRMLRIVFDGMTPFEPVIANMVLACGAPVNILFANTWAIEGKTVGQMIVQLPEAEDADARIAAYLNTQNVHYEEVADDVL
mgnify:CR=1 FL=1